MWLWTDEGTLINTDNFNAIDDGGKFNESEVGWIVGETADGIYRLFKPENAMERARLLVALAKRLPAVTQKELLVSVPVPKETPQ